MPTLKILLLLFTAWALAGGLRTFRQLLIHRRPSQAFQTIEAWSERPLSSWRYEPYSAAAILVHTLAISALSIAALAAASSSVRFKILLIPNDTTTTALLWIVEGGSISLIGYLLGSVLAFPLVRLTRSPVAFAITEDGMVIGLTLLPWRWFSHFSVDSREGILRLYSAFSPDLPSLVSRPTRALPLTEIGATLQRFLPTHPAAGGRAWYRTKRLLIPTMILVSVPLVAAGWLASHLSRELALFVIALCTTSLAALGSRIITTFGFGVRSLDEHTSGRPPAD